MSEAGDVPFAPVAQSAADLDPEPDAAGALVENLPPGVDVTGGLASAEGVDSTGGLASAKGVDVTGGLASAKGVDSTGGLASAELARTVEALLFLSSDPLSTRELAEVARADELEIAAALGLLAEQYAPGQRGIRLRELAGGYALATDPAREEAARRLFSRPRAATLTPAQAETLAIVAYLQPVSRPEITRIRGVSADSAATTLLERGLIEEAGRSQFGAVLYRTGTQFLKLFGLRSLSELPDVAQWDPTPEEQAELRERLLRAGEARTEGGPPPLGS